MKKSTETPQIPDGKNLRLSAPPSIKLTINVNTPNRPRHGTLGKIPTGS